MRDKLCKENNLNLLITCNRQLIAKGTEEIELLKADIKNNIQRYPGDNNEIILNKKGLIFKRLEEMVRAEYSLGSECRKLEELFAQIIKYAGEIDFEKIGYVNIVEFIALGILLEVPEEEFKILVDVADNEEVDDILLDYLINAYGLKRSYTSTKYEKENPYEEAGRIIEQAAKDVTKATLKLKEYIQKKWLKGHADYGWTKAHKEAGYYGLWSFEAAAIVKIFGLDDSELKEDNHYPYDMAHYKNGMRFNIDFL